MDGSDKESALNVNPSSIKISDVSQDGDTLTFAITSQNMSGKGGVCVFRTYEDFVWLQQSFFSQEGVPGLQGVIFPPLPGKPLPSHSQTQAKVLKQLGFLSLGDKWQIYCKALELYLQQVAAHTVLSKSKELHGFLSSSESTGKQQGKKGIFNRLSQAMEEMRKEGHKDVDEFFQTERNRNTDLLVLFKGTTEKFLEVVLTKQSKRHFLVDMDVPRKTAQCRVCFACMCVFVCLRVCFACMCVFVCLCVCFACMCVGLHACVSELALACGHFSTSLHLCVNQENADAVAFSKICLKLSDITEAMKRYFEKVSDNDMSTLGLGLELESRYQDAKREMLFRRTCRLMELENANKNVDRAKPNKKAILEEIQKATQKEFNLTSSVAKKEIGHYQRVRVQMLRSFLICWCEKQLSTARESATLFSQYLKACKELAV